MSSLSELDHRSVLGAGENITKLHLTRSVSTPFIVRVTLSRINDADGLAHIIEVHGAGESVGHLNVGKTLADAATGSNAEGAEGTGSQRNLLFGSLAAGEGVEGTSDPSLGHVLIGRGVVGLVVVDGIMGNTDDCALRDGTAFDGHAARENLTGDDTTDRWGHSHGL